MLLFTETSNGLQQAWLLISPCTLKLANCAHSLPCWHINQQFTATEEVTHHLLQADTIYHEQLPFSLMSPSIKVLTNHTLRNSRYNQNTILRPISVEIWGKIHYNRADIDRKQSWQEWWHNTREGKQSLLRGMVALTRIEISGRISWAQGPPCTCPPNNCTVRWDSHISNTALAMIFPIDYIISNCLCAILLQNAPPKSRGLTSLCGYY
jgi:hypothetical protein